MGQVFDSQFQAMHDAFARLGIFIEVAYAPNGRPDYMYEAERLLVSSEGIPVVDQVLPGAVRVVGKDEQPDAPSLHVYSIAHLHNGYLTVPQALDRIDEYLGDKNPALHGGFPLVTPVHILHVSNGSGSQPDTARNCPATEPEVPCCCAADEPCGPCPPAAAGGGGAGVTIGVCDTGLLAGIASAPWLGGITVATAADVDQLGPLLPNGLHDIPRYCGHGTFIAGVARCQAPESAVYVANDYIQGGLREWLIMQKLQALIARVPAPQVVNLSGGSYTRNDWPLLSFSAFEYGGTALTCSAGNDGTRRKFWPAAFDWAVGVGALGADQRNRAWFSNYGDWVDVYALGEGLVNAFATGQYTYKEPPKRPAVQVFDGRARWSGTSFSAPLVAGLIAARLSAMLAADPGASAPGAWAALKADAEAQAIPGLGPVLYPRQ
jgi:subtilisin family serine protease